MTGDAHDLALSALSLGEWPAAPAAGPTPDATTRPPADDASGLRVQARNLVKSFGDAVVLRNLSLDIAPGEFLAIVGRSGCGKSTLLRLIAGLDAPSGGRIRFGDEERARQPRDIRVMFQEPRLLPWASLRDNVAIGLGEAFSDAETRAKAQAALKAVGLADRADAWPSALSGGQRQRVALARALVSGPGVLALDEPLGALDALTRMDMQGLLEQVWREKGFTALLVTHDVSEAIALADRVVLIDHGQISFEQRIDLPRPRRRGTADFARLERLILERLLAPVA